MSEYRRQLSNPRWQKKRLRIFQRDQWKCAICGDTETELHAHHKKYVSGKKPWEYPDSDLQTLCATCHKTSHVLQEKVEHGNGICITWVYLGEDELCGRIIEPLEALIYERTYDDQEYVCQTLDGFDVMVPVSCGIIKEIKCDWITWAKEAAQLRAKVIEFSTQ